MIFQYLSDLHLEFYNGNISKVQRKFKITENTKIGDILLVAGDIGNPLHTTYKTFLTDMSLTFEHVFVTTGNHEYYKIPMTMNDIDSNCREICRSMPHDNVSFLQNEVYCIKDNIKIFGGTFWSHIPEKSQSIVSNSINDYKQIYEFTPIKSNELHNIAVTKLTNEIENSELTTKWIVMSHHMPLYNLIDIKYRSLDHINSAFATDIQIAKDNRIKAWVYGHTHTPRQDEKYYCNPIGYPGENKKIDLTKHFVL